MQEVDGLVTCPSLPAGFFQQVKTGALHPAQWERREGKYIPITYQMFSDRVKKVATGLIKAGVNPGDRVAILMENRPEWGVADFAILSVGAVTVPLYCSYRPQDIAYVLQDSGAVLAIVSSGQLQGHMVQAMDECPEIRGAYALGIQQPHEKMHLFSELEIEADDEQVQNRYSELTRDSLASLIYTSGTTASPKGVMLSHGNILSNLESVLRTLQLGDDIMLSFLPLAHAFERTGGHFLPYLTGFSVAFAERPDTVAKNLAEVSPSIMIAVPRMLEVIQSRILAQVAKQSGLHRALFHAFFEVSERKRAGNISMFSTWKYKLLNRLVGVKLRGKFGGNIRFFVSGGAPLSAEIGAFFETLGIPVVEGYGLTESAPILAITPEDDRRLGSVGRPPAGVEIQISEDGEILARGGNIMLGYWNLPDATAEVIQDGWLHTGDVGHLNDGYLYITDRKKDLIVNSGGENIAPQRVEAPLIGEPLIEQVIVYGDQHPYLVAMVVPNQDACMAWAVSSGMPGSGWQELASSEVLRKHIQSQIQQRLKTLNPHEQVRRIYIQIEPFTIENGFLTPTMKLKRRLINQHYAEIFESLYR